MKQEPILEMCKASKCRRSQSLSPRLWGSEQESSSICRNRERSRSSVRCLLDWVFPPSQKMYLGQTPELRNSSRVSLGAEQKEGWDDDAAGSFSLPMFTLVSSPESVYTPSLQACPAQINPSVTAEDVTVAVIQESTRAVWEQRVKRMKVQKLFHLLSFKFLH